MKLKFKTTCFILFIVFIASTFIIRIDNIYADINNEIAYISKTDATLLAYQIINKKINDADCIWNKTTFINENINLYDFDSNINAYLFRLNTNKINQGYILVNANAFEPSVQSFSYDGDYVLDSILKSKTGKKTQNKEKIIFADDFSFIKEKKNANGESSYINLATDKVIKASKKALNDNYRYNKKSRLDQNSINNLKNLKNKRIISFSGESSLNEECLKVDINDINSTNKLNSSLNSDDTMTKGMGSSENIINNTTSTLDTTNKTNTSKNTTNKTTASNTTNKTTTSKNTTNKTTTSKNTTNKTTPSNTTNKTATSKNTTNKTTASNTTNKTTAPKNTTASNITNNTNISNTTDSSNCSTKPNVNKNAYTITGILNKDYKVYTMLDFPDYDNHCGPVVGVNLIYYWTHGHPNKNSLSSLWDDKVFIDLYKYMKTKEHNTTYDFDLVNGLSQFAVNRKKPVTSSNTSDGSDWNFFKNNIDNNIPVVTLLHADPKYDNHYVLAVGYENDGGSNYLRILDGWFKSTNTFYKYRGSIVHAMYDKWN